MTTILNKILKWSSAASESDTDYDGPLSYAAEFHSLQVGLYHGVVDPIPMPRSLPANTDVQREPHYYKIGYCIGTGLQFAGVYLLLRRATDE